eukprot:4142833-Amphidinium_carterae.1
MTGLFADCVVFCALGMASCKYFLCIQTVVSFGPSNCCAFQCDGNFCSGAWASRELEAAEMSCTPA